MNTFQLNQAYDRSSFMKFLRSFLDDFSSDIEQLYPQNKSQFANECYRLGHDNELDLEVYEIHHSSTNDARVGIAKDAFKLLFSESLSNRALVVFVPEGSKQWRLSLLQIEAEANAKGRVEKTYSNPRRHSYLLGEGGSLTTPQKYLFEMGRIAPRKDGNKQLSAVEDLQSRFSVEALTKEFYNKLYNWYLWAVEPSTGVTFPNLVNTSKDDRDDIAIKIIRLITRLLFVWFIKQKGLVPKEIFDEDELNKILANFDPQSEKDGKYYNAILQNLFFATLNNEVGKRRFMSEPFQGKSNSFGVKTLFRDSLRASWFAIPQDEVLKLFHNVPFMNCGLFECLDKYAKSDIGQEEDMFLDGFSSRDGRQDGHFKYRAFVPNRLFFAEEHKETVTVEEDKKQKKVDIPVMGLLPLLKLYNFTVQENTPSEVEVSLDPELLGQVFENLLAAYNPETKESARKSTGSFYTPRPIVEYMVNESLIEYLKTKVPSVAEENWRALISYDDVPFTLSDNERIATLNALYECKILDPACGSGAFPMGMLQQMVHITRKLDSEFDPYKTKLRIINNCIYGSDIQPIAMLISKLRFFISLICEQDDKAVNFDDEENNFGINTLPNLETKFVAANSLLTADIHRYADDNWTLDPNLIKLKNELLKIRQEHFSVRTQTTKLRKREEDRLKRQEIQDYILQSTTQPNAELVQMYESRIRHLTSERGLYEGEKIVEEIVSTQTELFAEVEQKTVRKDVNKIQRDRIDAEISDLRKSIAKEQNKRNPVGFNAAIKQIADWNPYDQLKAAPFFDPDWMFGITSGFDIVIGNPPYVVSGDAIYQSYQTFDCHELYAYFFEMATKNLKDNGVLSFITASLYVKGLKFGSLRNYLESNLDLVEYIYQGDDIFENVNMPTATIVARKAQGQWSCDDFDPGAKLAARIAVGQKQIDQISQIQRGLEIGREDVDNIGKYPCLTGTLVSKYVPHAIKYISQQILDAYGKDEKFFTKERILLRETGSSLLAVYLNEHIYSNRSLYSIIITDKQYKTKYVLACINSSLLQFYYQVRFKAETDLFPKIRIAQAKLLPIPLASEAKQAEVIKLVDEIIATKKKNPQADTSDIESQINILVYLLYKLTYEEVRIIDPKVESLISEAEYNKRLNG